MSPNFRFITLVGIAALILATAALAYAQDSPEGENWLSMDQGPESSYIHSSDMPPDNEDSHSSAAEIVHISAKEFPPETKQIEYLSAESPDSNPPQVVTAAPKDTLTSEDKSAPEDKPAPEEIDTAQADVSLKAEASPAKASVSPPADEPGIITPPEKNPLDRPENPTPAEGSENQPLNPMLRWSGDNDDREVTYTVYVGTSPTSMPEEYTVVKNSLVLPVSLDQSTTYYWKVEASDGDEAVSSDIWSFTTQERPNRPPDKPQDPRPLDGAKDIQINPTLSWSGEDPDGDAIEYTVSLSTNSSSEPLEFRTKGKSLSIPSNLSSGVTYYWKVEVSDGRLDNASDTWSFTTQSEPNCPPGKPKDPKPDNYAKDQPTNPTLSWDGGEDLDGDPVAYKVFMGPTLNQMTQIYDGPEKNCSAPTSNYGVTNFWKVEASDGKLNNSSDVWSFTTKGQPVWEQPNTVNALIGAISAVIGGFAANYVRGRKK